MAIPSNRVRPMRMWVRAVVLGAGVAVAAGVMPDTTEPRSAQASALTGKIVFLRYQVPDGVQWDIYAMNADGSGQRSLTSGPADDSFPAWSPDGRRVAFQRFLESTNSDIFVMNADGSGMKDLTKTPSEDTFPAWSPDGRKITFSSEGSGAVSQIFVMNADGRGKRRLTNTETQHSASAWSPDGTKIAFTTASGIDRSAEIFLMNSDGSGQTNLTNNTVPDYGPAWSPDGARIAFVRGFGNNRFEIFVMNADGSDQTNVSNTLGYNESIQNESPTWSPDGTRVAFATNRGADGNDEIYVMNADGSSQTNLTHSGANDLQPDWNAQLLGPRPRTCGVPRVVGQTIRAARTRIRRANCSVGRIRRARSRRVGRVLSQSPRAGTVKRRGFPVKLVVGRRY